MEEVPLPRIPARIFSPKNSVRYGFIFRPITKLIMDWNPGQDWSTPENPRIAAAITVAPIPLFTPFSRIFATLPTCLWQNRTITTEPTNILSTTIAFVFISVRLERASTSTTTRINGISATQKDGRSSLVGWILTGWDSSIAVPSLIAAFFAAWTM